MNDRSPQNHSKNSLQHLTTFAVAAQAGETVEVTQCEQLDGLRFDPQKDLILGGGSNVLLTTNVPGKVILNRMAGKKVITQSTKHTVIEAGAGEPWHEFVLWTIEQGWSGLENLALIPGLTGAAPVQNIGAYGVELSDTFHGLEVWDWHTGTTRWMDPDECQLAYRNSRFKQSEPNRFFITRVQLRLNNHFQPQLEYAGLKERLKSDGKMNPTAKDVCRAVIELRTEKLPNPSHIGNAGSFFKNPVISNNCAARLLQKHPRVPLHQTGNGEVKTSAAWMIDQCGWKGFRQQDAGISAQHALVLVNYGAATGSEILALSRRVQESVNERFGIQLEPEPKIVAF